MQFLCMKPNWLYLSKYLYLLLLFTFCFAIQAFADGKANGPVVIVSSYNPEIKRISDVIETFSNEYHALGGKKTIKVENMNCRNLSESPLWKERLWGLLKNYYQDGNMPSGILLLGNEASSTYFSIDRDELRKTPIIIGSRSNNIVKLPENSNEDLSTWTPKAYMVAEDFKDYNIVGGVLYEYDVQKNVELMKSLYPKCDSVYLLTDNTLGGVNMRSYVMQQMKEKYPDITISSIDGRRMSLFQVSDTISKLSGNKAIMIGTWRVDSSDSYFIGNMTASLGAANPSIPAFSISMTGISNWAIGGYVPDYHDYGKELAKMAINYDNTETPLEPRLFPSHYCFDYIKLGEYNIDKDKLPKDYVLLNEPANIWKDYLDAILGVLALIIFLTVALVTSIHFMRKYKKLQVRLAHRGKELEEACERAEQANVLKSAFIANVTHEIRTPLNAILGFTQLITSPDMPLTDDEMTEYGKYIQQNGETLMKLINDILDISKMDADTMSFSKEKSDIVKLCRKAVESAMSNLSEDVNLVSNLPSGPIWVNTDAVRLQQVLNNLMSNAKKFTDLGTITVALELSEDGKTAFVSVSDTGCGIPADKAEYVFERFKQLNSFKQGTGLGLSISRSIIEHLGGKIWLDTSYTAGARFVFTHPVAD